MYTQYIKNAGNSSKIKRESSTGRKVFNKYNSKRQEEALIESLQKNKQNDAVTQKNVPKPASLPLKPGALPKLPLKPASSPSSSKTHFGVLPLKNNKIETVESSSGDDEEEEEEYFSSEYTSSEENDYGGVTVKTSLPLKEAPTQSVLPIKNPSVKNKKERGQNIVVIPRQEPVRKIISERIHVHQDFLIRTQGKFDMTEACDASRLEIQTLLKTKEGKDGIEHFIWMPNVSCTSPSKPVTGYVLTISDPKNTPVDPRIFNPEKFYWGTFCFRVPSHWVNTKGHTILETLKKRENVMQALEETANESPDIRNSGFLGVYVSNLRRTGWRSDVYLVVQCNNREKSLKMHKHITKVFRKEKEGKEKGFQSTLTDDWEACFGHTSPTMETQKSSSETRISLVCAVLKRLDFGVTPSMIIKETWRIHTVQNFCRWDQDISRWVFYNGCSRITMETRALILHERPLYGLVLLIGPKSEYSPLGKPWKPKKSLSLNAFPCATGRVLSLRKPASRTTVETGERFFVRGGRSAEEHQRLKCELYRKRDGEWIKQEYKLGRPKESEVVDLKPYMVRCSDPPKKMEGLLSTMISS